MWAVYALHDPCGAVRYIGISKDPIDRVKRHYRECRTGNTKRKNWLRSILVRGEEPLYSVLEWTDDWNEAERRWITYFKASGACLVNGNDGGTDMPQVNAKNHSSVDTPYYRKTMQKLGLLTRSDRYYKPSPETVAKLQHTMKLLAKRKRDLMRRGEVHLLEQRLKESMETRKPLTRSLRSS